MEKKSIITAILAAVLAFALGGYYNLVCKDSQMGQIKNNLEFQQQSTNNLVLELKKQVDRLEGTSEEVSKVEPTKSTETADWKTYSNEKNGFNVKYPKDWQVEENAKSQTDGYSYIGMNIFSNENVVFKNTSKQYAIAINWGSILGRGGSCVKRSVQYELELIKNMIKLTKKSDEIIKNKTGSNDYCGGIDLKGFSISSEKFTYNNVEYFVHSENTNVTDTVSTDAVKMFEQIISTMEFVK